MMSNPEAVEYPIVKPTGKHLRWCTSLGCFAAAISIGGCFAKGAALNLDCKGADPNTTLTMKFTDGKLSVTDASGSSDFYASLDGDLEQTFSISGAVTRDMIMPVPDALDSCITAQLTKINKKVTDKNAFGASRQFCFTKLFPTGTKQSVDVTYSVVVTEPGTADLLIHSQYKSAGKLSSELLYVNQMPDPSCTTQLIK